MDVQRAGIQMKDLSLASTALLGLVGAAVMYVGARQVLDGSLTVVQGHDIAEAAEHAVRRRHRVLNVLTHVDPVRVIPEISAQPPKDSPGESYPGHAVR